MHLRPCQPEDISALVDIQLQCDRTDPLVLYRVQNTDRYPATYRHTTLRFLRQKLLEPGCVAFVAETDDDLDPSSHHSTPGTVVGWAVWTRHGSDEVARRWQRPGSTIFCAIETALLSLQNRYYDVLDPTVNTQHMSNIMPIISKDLATGSLQESWELDGMYVAPAWQRHGVGRLLLQWGLQQARNESVPIVCKSSSLGVSFYERAGFTSLEEQRFDPFFDPGYNGYHSMVWNPNVQRLGSPGLLQRRAKHI